MEMCGIAYSAEDLDDGAVRIIVHTARKLLEVRAQAGELYKPPKGKMYIVGNNGTAGPRKQ
jgi:hypothetical protein